MGRETLFTRQMARVGGVAVSDRGYAGFVAVARQLQQGRTAAQQQAMVGRLLRSLVPAPLRWLVRTGVRPTRWVYETNAWFATVLFPWLVGPLSQVAVGEAIERRGVKIQRSRYLEASLATTLFGGAIVGTLSANSGGTGGQQKRRRAVGLGY